MGLGSFVKKAAKKAKKAAKKAAKIGKRATVAVATGGLSEIAPGAVSGITDVIGSALVPTSVGDLTRTASLLAGPTAAVLTGGAVLPISTTPTTIGSQGGSPVGLENILGGLKGVLGTIGGFGGTTGQIAQVGSSFLSGFLPAQGPVRTTMPAIGMTPTMTMATVPQAVGALAGSVQAVLAKIAINVGRSVTVQSAMSLVRKLMTALQRPEVVAATLGLSIAELGLLVTANASRTRRRMNPANIKALRRAHRRVEGFHRLCGKNDQLRAPRRRSSKKPIIVNTTGRVCA